MYVVEEEWQVEEEGEELATEEEEACESGVERSLGEREVVQLAAQVDRVDVVALEVREHDDVVHHCEHEPRRSDHAEDVQPASPGHGRQQA